jgi:hypothetical protein
MHQNENYSLRRLVLASPGDYRDEARRNGAVRRAKGREMASH